MIYLTCEQVLELHDELINTFGGIGGIRELGLLESAVAAPMMAVFGVERHVSVYDKAGCYLYHIVRNHPFVDGNKRTAAAVALIFLRKNRQSPKYDVDEFVHFVASVAQGKVILRDVAAYLEKMCIHHRA